MRGAAVLLFLIASVGGASPPDGRTQTGTLIVQVDGFVSREGSLRFALFNGPEGFPSKPEAAIRRVVFPVQGQVETARFEGVPFGSCAVSVLHDLNGNGRLDRNFLGIPREPIAVSNNPRLRFGPPRYEAARFEFNVPEMSIAIHLPRSVEMKEESRP
jgi:uncharacterized protein (DUF2141 family)